MKKYAIILMSVLILTLLSVGCSEKEKTITFDDALKNTKVSDFTSEYDEYETIADIIDGFEELNKGDGCKVSVTTEDSNDKAKEFAEIENSFFEYDDSKKYKLITISCDFSFGAVGSVDPEYMVLFSMDADGNITPIFMINGKNLEKEPDKIIEQLCIELNTAKTLVDAL